MRIRHIAGFMLVTLIAASAAVNGQTPTNRNATGAKVVCFSIDAAHDTLSRQDRSAALLMLEKQFVLNGVQVVSEPCDVRYTLSHIQLGTTFSVTLAGPDGDREATALGLDDLPALY